MVVRNRIEVNQDETYDYSDAYFKPGTADRLKLQNGVVAAEIAVLNLNAEWASEDEFNAALIAAHTDKSTVGGNG